MSEDKEFMTFIADHHVNDQHNLLINQKLNLT